MRNKFQYIFIIAVAAILIGCGATVPQASFQTDDQAYDFWDTVKFANSSVNAESYLWDFGNGKTSTLENPSHAYYESGKFTVSLYAKTGDQVDTLQQTVIITPPEDCQVKLETKFGDMIIKLYDDTPLHRNNFLKLAEQGFYDDLLFHRVIKQFMVQGGDPDSKNAPSNKRLGSGGPGYTIPAEINDERKHFKGTLAGARMPDHMNPKRASSGSQFYIVDGRVPTAQQMNQLKQRGGYTDEQVAKYLEVGGTPHLDGQYTVFGEVISGLNIIDSIANVQTKPGDRPVEDIKMKVSVVN